MRRLPTPPHSSPLPTAVALKSLTFYCRVKASIYERCQSASYAAHFDTTTPLNVALGSDAHFHQLACAASALASASTPLTSAPTTPTVAASLCPPPAADANGIAVLPAQSAQPTHLRLSAPARRTPGKLVFVLRRLWPACACHEHEGRSWTGCILSLTKRSVLVAFPFAADEHCRRFLRAGATAPRAC
eukprot:5403706-Pleurochrysis_carterae.AAC.1